MDHPGQLIVICGLGGLGQACLRTLRQFDVPVRYLDLSPPMGIDGIGQARAVLLLSSYSGVNLEAALQVRLLNPLARGGGAAKLWRF